jgi:hypothetical protein
MSRYVCFCRITVEVDAMGALIGGCSNKRQSSTKTPINRKQTIFLTRCRSQRLRLRSSEVFILKWSPLRDSNRLLEYSACALKGQVLGRLTHVYLWTALQPEQAAPAVCQHLCLFGSVDSFDRAYCRPKNSWTLPFRAAKHPAALCLKTHLFGSLGFFDTVDL